jgi:hypothetical protein
MERTQIVGCLVTTIRAMATFYRSTRHTGEQKGPLRRNQRGEETEPKEFETN